MESAQTQKQEHDNTEERLVVEIPTEIRAGRSEQGSGYCLYPKAQEA